MTDRGANGLERKNRLSEIPMTDRGANGRERKNGFLTLFAP